MKTKDWRVISSWHFIDVLHVFWVLLSIWNLINEIGNGSHEVVVWLEAVLVNPEVGVARHELSVKGIGDSSTILYLANHVLHSFEGIW